MKELGLLTVLFGSLVLVVTSWGFVIAASGLLMFLQGLKQEVVTDLVAYHERKLQAERLGAERVRLKIQEQPHPIEPIILNKNSDPAN